MRTTFRQVTAATVGVFGFACLAHVAFSQTATTKVYRGAVGTSHIQMRLSFNGNNVSGTYSYDNVGDDLKLRGRLDQQGRLELSEFDAKGKQTGKFVCKGSLDDPTDSECSWSRTDGTHESLVILKEQHVAFTNGMQITPKTITNRRTGVGVSYPQITSSGALNPAAQAFNRRILALTQKSIGEFAPIDGRGSFDANYNVLLGTDDLVSIEMTVFNDGGGAHPNDYFWSLNYDLKANKELRFEDLFKAGTDYTTAIANYIVADIDKRAAGMEQADARRSGRKPEPREGPIVSIDQLSEQSGWGLTPNGLNVYFDLPHVIAVFDKNFIPYSVIQPLLRPNGPAARSQSQ